MYLCYLFFAPELFSSSTFLRNILPSIYLNPMLYVTFLAMYENASLPHVFIRKIKNIHSLNIVESSKLPRKDAENLK